MRNVRRGGLARSRFTVAVWISNHRPDATIDLDWEFGRGVLSEQEFARLTASAEEDLDQYCSIAKLCLSQGSVQGDFRRLPLESGPGWFLLHFEAPEGTAEGEPYDRLEIEISSFVDRRQGWFYYGLPRTVSDRLAVSFRAPFEYGVVPRLGRGSTFSGPTLIGKDYLTEVKAEGPVPMGRTIVWIYGQALQRESDRMEDGSDES